MVLIEIQPDWIVHLVNFNHLFLGGNGFQMSFGIGAFPFGFFATNFNLGENHSGHAHVHGMRGHGTGNPEGTAQYAEEQFLHKVKHAFS